MEISESPLDVLSRAATMVKDGLPVTNNADDTTNKIYTTKQVPPTTKWKRERRSRLPEYSRKSDPKLPENLPPELLVDHLDESNNSLSLSPKSSDGSSTLVDTPLDMSIRQRGLPPTYSQAISNPSYRTSFRPSVITPTTAHHQDNGKYVSPKATAESKSISMCDPIIDEHFRRSLGKDYAVLFSNNNVTTTTTTTAPTTLSTIRTTPVTVEQTIKSNKTTKSSLLTKQQSTTEQENGIIASFKEMMDTDSASLSVDDHFAKALGDTWFKLNKKENELNNKKHKATSEKNENTIRVLTI